MDSNEEYLDQLLKSMMKQEFSEMAAERTDSEPVSIPEDLSDGFSDELSEDTSDASAGEQPETPEEEPFDVPAGEQPGAPEEAPLDVSAGEQPETSEEEPFGMPGEELSGAPGEDLPDVSAGELPEDLFGELPEADSMLPQMELPDIGQEMHEEDAEISEETGAGTEDIDELLKMISGETQEEAEGVTQSEGNSEESAPDLDAALEMSQEDIERLLAANRTEVQETEPLHYNMGQEDLNSIMADLGEDSNEDVQEISELLNKAEHDEPVDDALTALLQGLTEDEPQDRNYSAEEPSDGEEAEQLLEKPARRKKKEKVRKEKGSRRNRNKTEILQATGTTAEDMGELTGGIAETETSDNGAALSADHTKPEKKPGLFGKLLNALTEEGMEEAAQVKSVSNENDEILRQMEQEEQEKGRNKKKKKAEGKKKGKGSKTENRTARSGRDETGEDGADKKKKEKKNREEKKEKKEKPVTAIIVEEEHHGRKLSMKKVLPVLLAAVVVTAAYVVVSQLYVDYLNKQKATDAFYAGDYLECYELLFGQNLNENQAVMYHKSELILQMERAKKNYQTYLMEGKDLEALDYLVQFLYGYEEYRLKGQEWNSLEVVEETHTGMVGLLTANYGLTEAQAAEIAALEKDTDYTLALMAVLEGTYGKEEPTEEPQDNASAYEDMLPEELEEQDTVFIDTIE